jgi:outer membrane protein assembly factor BamB
MGSMRKTLSLMLRWHCALAAAGATALAGEWPQWRGPARDGHASVGASAVVRLSSGTSPVWKLSIGPGFSSPIVAAGKLIYLDAQAGREVVHAADAVTGRELWKQDLAEAFGDEWGTGPRSTPFADGDHLFVQSCNGEFRCLALADGRTLWGTNFAGFGITFLGSKAREGTASRRGNNGSGVCDSERVYVPVGSTNGATVVAFDKRTGRVLWRAMNEEAAYSSLMLGAPGGVEQVVALAGDSLAGLDRRTGQVLWRVPFRTAAKRHAATPVMVGDLVVVNSHSFGMVATRITRDGDRLKAVEAWANRALKINLSTPVLVAGHLYGQGANKDYVCVDATTGQLKWSQPGYGRGTKDNCSTIAVGQNLLVLCEDGQLALIKADPQKHVELARVQACGSTWSHPAYADGRLYTRDERELKCFELGSPAETPRP